LLTSARRVSEAAVAWTVTASTLAIFLGVTSASIALVAFGAVGFVDAAGSVALAHHFRHGLKNDLEDRFERRAHRIVAVGLVSVGGATIVVSAARLVGGRAPDVSAAAVVLAAVSSLALVVLSVRKRAIGRRVPSAALMADGHLSAIGAMQALVTLFGIGATRWFGWDWADAIAALIVGAVAVGLGVQSMRELRHSGRTDPDPSARES
jgi:divalent metal cation (Fe/Co/Zn/Cd) transporter